MGKRYKIYSHWNLVFFVINIFACTSVEDVICNDENQVFLVIIAISGCNIHCMSDPIPVLLRALCPKRSDIIFHSDTFATDKNLNGPISDLCFLQATISF